MSQLDLEGAACVLLAAWAQTPSRLRLIHSGIAEMGGGWVKVANKVLSKSDAELLAAAQEWDKWGQKHQAKLIPLSHHAYPELLRHVPDAPLALFWYGGELPNWRKAISVVGTRQATNVGRTWINHEIPELIAAKMVTVSGLARGIDYEVHRVTIAHRGVTIAVLPASIDQVYPKGHKQLIDDIVQSGGGVMTEIFPEGSFHKGMFLRRNRIIAALTPATLVVEAASGSGSLTTARMANSYGREVLALPGETFRLSAAGGLSLIVEEMARTVRNAQDILSVMGIDIPQQTLPAPQLDPDMQSIVVALRTEPLGLSALCAKIDKQASHVLSLIMQLELAGFVSQLSTGQYYVTK